MSLIVNLFKYKFSHTFWILFSVKAIHGFGLVIYSSCLFEAKSEGFIIEITCTAPFLLEAKKFFNSLVKKPKLSLFDSSNSLVSIQSTQH